MNWSEQDLLNYQRRHETLTPDKKDIKGNSNTAVQNKSALTGKFGANRKGPNKTEMEYGRMLAYEFPKCEVVPFGITLRLANNHKYTPDYVVKLADGRLLCVEVKQRGKGKNGFRQPSYQRARVMFDQCRVEYPLWVWRWSEKHDGTWSGKDY